MGCDGGTIPRRDELVRTKKKKEAKDKEAEAAAKWKYCASSSKELTPPVVSCELGRLYNKDAVIEYLLNKESSPNALLLAHIRNLKDIVELKLTPKKSASNDSSPKNGGESSSSSASSSDSTDYKYICPVVGLEMNGKYKFQYIRTCGCVLSERAIKEVKSDVCLACNKPFLADDLITINGDDEEIKQLQERMNERRNRQKELKRKRKNPETSTSSETTSISSINRKSSKEMKKDDNGQEVSIVKTSSRSVLSGKAAKSYSVNKDPTASEAYKSLFTTHQSAKNRPKAHWVTFNPQYN